MVKSLLFSGMSLVMLLTTLEQEKVKDKHKWMRAVIRIMDNNAPLTRDFWNDELRDKFTNFIV